MIEQDGLGLYDNICGLCGPRTEIRSAGWDGESGIVLCEFKIAKPSHCASLFHHVRERAMHPYGVLHSIPSFRTDY